WEKHFSFQKSCGLGTSLTAILYGITQNPETLDYMIIMTYIEQGSLRHQLPKLANKEIFNVWRSSDEFNYSSTELNSSTPIHPNAIYTGKHYKFTDLPDPVNSIEIPHFNKEKYT
ncbi:4165_t:CDS:2, partial [Cetraspora pellucida]